MSDATGGRPPPLPAGAATARPGAAAVATPPLGPDKQERLARLYDTEVLPAFAGPFASLLLRALDVRPAARVVEIGCATGHLTLELSRRFDAESRIVAVDAAPALVAQAQARLEGHARTRIEVAALPRLPGDDGAADIVVSNLTWAEQPDPRQAARELVRLLAPGGQLVVTVPLRGTWGEFLDIYRDVLRENGKPDGVRALEQYVASLPDADGAARWLEAAGLGEVEITVDRWEILFKSAREFFFAPVIELGPLSRWKQVVGRGDEMQDIFFFTKEAIDTYFRGTVFPVTIVGAALKGWKPIAPPR